jgi:cell division cycle 20-like protein 1 (cofactor of APC complex)
MQVLYAPMLADDFYLNLLDWSSHNVLSVGLGSHAYLKSLHTEQVEVLCKLSESSNSVTSVAWNEQVSNNSITLFLCRAVNCHC